jgi:hypothetical protein
VDVANSSWFPNSSNPVILTFIRVRVYESSVIGSPILRDPIHEANHAWQHFDRESLYEPRDVFNKDSNESGRKIFRGEFLCDCPRQRALEGIRMDENLQPSACP